MRAYTVKSFEHHDLFHDVPDPQPGPGEVLLDIHACGLNFADLLMIEGTYQATPELPFVPGLEVCGSVTSCGEGVQSPAVGTRVAVFGGQGGLADKGVFAAAHCLQIPAAMPSVTAAGFMVAYGTSHLALTRRARLQPGETLVVTGAAGGVGLTAVEIGKISGANVIAIARGDAKLAIAEAAGADQVIDAADPDMLAKIKAAGGADVVYDAVGGDLFKTLLRACNREARILLIGFASGKVPEIAANHLLVKNVDITGFYWGDYLNFRPDALRQSLSELLALYENNVLKPHISHVLPLERTAEGFDLIKSRKATGKVVITP